MPANSLFTAAPQQTDLQNLQLQQALAQQMMGAKQQPAAGGGLGGGLNSIISPIVSAMIQKDMLQKRAQMMKNYGAQQNQAPGGYDPQTLMQGVPDAQHG